MLERFYPSLKVKSVYDIDFNRLKKSGIKGVIFDIDNTLVPSYQKTIDEKIINLINKFDNAGFKTAIVSNATKRRVELFVGDHKIFNCYRALKRSKRGFLKAIDYMTLQNEEVAIIGDQIFTDIFGGNKLNMFTVLVDPIDKGREVFTVLMKRGFEDFVLKRYYSNQNKQVNN